METHEFDITITPTGEVRVHVKGAKGPACEEYAVFFQRILAGESRIERTAEYYEPPTGVEIRIDQET